MAKYVYPAVFTRDKEGYYYVNFPDVQSCYTDGDTLAEAIENASDVLALMLCDMQKESIPTATPIKDISTDADSFVSLILCDTDHYPMIKDAAYEKQH